MFRLLSVPLQISVSVDMYSLQEVTTTLSSFPQRHLCGVIVTSHATHTSRLQPLLPAIGSILHIPVVVMFAVSAETQIVTSVPDLCLCQHVLTGTSCVLQSPMHYSNVSLVDTSTNKPVRVTYKWLDDGTRVTLHSHSLQLKHCMYEALCLQATCKTGDCQLHITYLPDASHTLIFNPCGL